LVDPFFPLETVLIGKQMAFLQHLERQ
jgi:hypothetical protein